MDQDWAFHSPSCVFNSKGRHIKEPEPRGSPPSITIHGPVASQSAGSLRNRVKPLALVGKRRLAGIEGLTANGAGERLKGYEKRNNGPSKLAETPLY